MADINIAITAKNDASAALASVNADLANLAKTATDTGNAMLSIGRTQFSLGAGSTVLRDTIKDLQNATTEATRLKQAVSEPAKVQNAGGFENVSASIKAAEAELDRLLKKYQELAAAGKLDFGAGANANLTQAQTAIAQQLGTLKQLKAEAQAAAKAGVLGDGAAPAAQINQVTRAAQLMQQALKGDEDQAKKTATAVSNVGKGGGLGNLKNELAGVDQAFGNLGNAVTGGIGGAAGLIGLGATAAAVVAVTGAINDAVLAADRVGKLRASFDQLAASAGTSGDTILKSLRAASSGMITDADLILSANKAMMLGVADNAQEMVALLDIARSRGQAMGLDVSQAFNDIVTGLGRESALILDNLGITINAASAMDTYAASISKTADQLTSAERKQALLNAVMEQSKGITTAPATGPGAAAQQANVAAQNAQVVVGDFFAPVFREYYDAQSDFINASLGRWQEYATRVRDINQIAADFAGDQRNDPKQTARFAELAAAMNAVQQALAAGVPEAETYATALQGIATQAQLTRNISDQTANTIELAASGIKAEAEAYAQLRASLDQLDPKLDNNRQQTQQVATAEEQAAASAVLAKYSVDALGTSMSTAAAMAQAMAGGLSQVQAQAGATAGIIYNLTGAMTGLASASNKNLSKSPLDSVIPQINALGGTLVSQVGLSPAQALDKVNELKIQAADITREMQAQGKSDAEIQLVLAENVRQTQEWASEVNRLNSQGLEQTKQQFDDIKGKVAGLIQQATQLPTFKASDLYTPDELKAKGLTGDQQISVDQAANGGIQPDAINENAKRLMAIAKEGLANQPWLEEFKKEVPEVFKELEQSSDVKGTAFRMLKEFEAGMRPELLDRGAIKDRVKQMIIGDQNAAALANEIAQEIAQEMGIPLQQALAATQGALGVATGTGTGAAATGVTAPDMTPQGTQAGGTFRAGFVAGFDATGMTTEIVAKIDAEFSNPKSWLALNKSGTAVGAVWAGGFVAGASKETTSGVYEFFAAGLLPYVVAALQASGSRTGAQP